MSAKDIFILFGVLACMFIMGLLRTRKLVRDTEERRNKNDSESVSGSDK